MSSEADQSRRRHGKFRPSLTNLVASNTDDDVAKATEAAFSHYTTSPNDIAGTLKLLSTPLKGVGPATASLYLAVHDPTRIIFFSDEAYKWLVDDAKLKYDVKEYVRLHEATQEFVKKLGVAPIEVEKVAFVLMKEKVSEKKTAEPKEPFGRPPGRPVGTTKASKGPHETSRRSERQSTASDSAEAKVRKNETKRTVTRVSNESKAGIVKSSASESKKLRGRPPGKKVEQESEGSNSATDKKRGRPPGKKAEQESSDSETGKKRGRPPGPAKEKSAKRVKA